MKIRKATLNDISKIDEIYIFGSFDEEKLQNKKIKKSDWIEMMSKHKKSRQSSMKEDIQNPREYWIVAEEKEIVGFGQVVINNSTQAELEKLYVDKKFRGKGIASKIEKELENWLKKKKIKRIYSRILMKNVPSIKFHNKKGFKQTAVRMDKILK